MTREYGVMKVTDIAWLSRDAQEADVTVSDGSHSCVCFSQPCTVAVGEAVADPLHPFSVTTIERVADAAPGVGQRDDSVGPHVLVAEVTDARAGLLRVGGLVFEIEEPLPGDVTAGDTVRLSCARIDLW